MPSPKDIKKVLNTAQGTKAAGKAMDLEELLGTLPKGTKAQQLEAELMFKRLAEEQAARYAPTNPPTKRGNAALAEAKKTLAKKQAPAVIIPSKISNVERAVRESKGEYGARRVQRAADQIKNLEDQYTEDALRNAFTGDNATALMIGNPADFKYFAAEMGNPYQPALEGYLQRMAPGGSGAEDVPFLQLNQNEGRLPFVSGHEGRHRNIAMEQLQYPSTLWRMLPRAALREDFPRRGQDEYLEALIKHLGTDEPLVVPEGQSWGAAINLPKLFAEGGLAMAGGGKALRKAMKGASKADDAVPDIRALVDANRPLTATERVMIGKPTLEPERRAALMNAERALPLNLPRAAAKSKQEIAAHAERVGRQMLGEHVRSGKPKDTQNLAGRSLKESQRLQNLRYELEPLKELPPVTTVDPRIGDINVAVPGDTSISDLVLKSIEDEPIGSVQQGGSLYGLGKLDRDDPLFWSSNEGPAQQMQDKITDVAVLFEPERVLAQHLAMGRVANNFAQHFADASLRAIDYSKLSAKDMNTFDSVIAGGYTKKNQKTGEVQYITFPHWPGIADPEGALATMKADPELRKWFLSRMKTPKLTQATNMPNALDIEWAITHPELRNMEVNLTGHSVGEMVPGAKLADDPDHETYLKGIRGRFLGQQENLTPFAISYPDATQHIATTQRPQDFTGTIQKVFPHQRVDQQYIDEYGEYMRQLNKILTGRKNGGVVHMQGGGDPGDVSGEMFKPKPLTIPSPLTDMADAIRRQFSKEKRSMSKPGAATDVLLRGPIAFAAGTPMDLIGMGGDALDYLQTRIPSMRKNASVMDEPRSIVDKRPPDMGYAPKIKFGPDGVMPYGTEDFQNKLRRAGLTTDEERPLLELGAGIFAPFAASKALKYGKASAQALAPTAKDMLETQLLRATDPMRMNIVPDGGPSGKLKAPANDLGFYNPAEKAALNLQRKKGTGATFVSDLKKQPGVNDERLTELGLGDLASRPNVTKEELIAAAEQNRIPLRETVARERNQTAIDELESQYDDLTYELENLQNRDDLNPTSIAKVESEIQRNINEQKRLKDIGPEARFGPATSPDYSLPGGQNYREIRVGLPAKEKPQYFIAYKDGSTMGTGFASRADAEAELADLFGSRPDLEIRQGVDGRSMTAKTEDNFFHSTHHGDEPNVLFHLRVADHVDSEGKKGLLIDELQSDWHQQGRTKGYRGNAEKDYNNYFESLGERFIAEQKQQNIKAGMTPTDAEYYATEMYSSLAQREGHRGIARAMGEEDKMVELSNQYKRDINAVPDAPFKENWYQLGIKRAIKEAADTGMDRVYLTTGARQADRYDLSKRVSYIDYRKSSVYNKYELGIADIDGDPINLPKERYSAEELPDIVGKEVADKIIKGEGESGGGRKTLRGLDLKIGGEGMKQYYDKTYKNFLDKYAKQFGARVGETKIPTDLAGNQWPNFRDWMEANYPDLVSRSMPYWYAGTSNAYVRAFQSTLSKKYEPVYYIDITPKMRESTKKGQSYKDGGAVAMAAGGAVDYESRFNQMLQDHVAGMAQGGAVDYESRFNDMLQKHVQGMAEGGAVNEYNADPDMADGGRFIQAPAFAEGGAVKSIWTVN